MKKVFALLVAVGMGLCALPAHAQLVTYYSPVVTPTVPMVSSSNYGYGAAPTIVNYGAATTTYYTPAVATNSCCAPAVATTAYYAPSVPVTAYYEPAVPVTTYYAPAVTTTYYAPVTYYRPYVPVQPVRNFFRGPYPVYYGY